MSLLEPNSQPDRDPNYYGTPFLPPDDDVNQMVPNLLHPLDTGGDPGVSFERLLNVDGSDVQWLEKMKITLFSTTN